MYYSHSQLCTEERIFRISPIYFVLMRTPPTACLVNTAMRKTFVTTWPLNRLELITGFTYLKIT